MKKINLVYGGWLYSSNGVSSVLNEFKKQTKYFERNGYNMEFFTLENISPSGRHITSKENAKVMIQNPFIHSLKSLLRKWAKNHKFLSIILLKRMFMSNPKKIVKYYFSSNEKCDIAFFQDLFTCYFFLKKNHDSSLKTVVVLHNSGNIFDALFIYFPKLKGSRFHQKILDMEHYVAEHVSRIGFVSEIAMDNFNKIHKEKYKYKTFFVYNGVEDSEVAVSHLLRESIPKYRLCCVGNVIPRKGQLFVIEAMSKLPEKLKNDFLFTIVGTGPEITFLKKKVAKFGLTKSVLFAGQTSNVYPYLKQSNLFILLSLSEGLPMVIIEAMQCKMPCIVSSVGGIPEMVENGKNGIVIEPNTQSLLNLFEHMDEYNWIEMGEESRRIYCLRFTSLAMIDGYCSIFKTL